MTQQQTIKFEYNDGGRSAAGFQATASDCVVRAVAIAGQYEYAYVYDALAHGNATERRTKHSQTRSGRRSARSGISTSRKWFKAWMATHGWSWTPTMQIGQGCRVHLRADELPSGRLIVSVSRHLCAVIDGVVHDTHDPSRNGLRCVYGYWTKASK
jgi:hypothetical protein